METEMILTGDSNIIEIEYASTIDGRKPHDIMKDYVAGVVKHRLYDKAFDLAWNMGVSHGTIAYKTVITNLLREIDIEPKKLTDHMNKYLVPEERIKED